MDQSRRVRVVVEMVRQSDPIAGTVETGNEAPRAFMGWMDLVAALEEARAHGDQLERQPDRGLAGRG